MSMYTIGKFLSRQREKVGLTKQELAKRLYVRTKLIDDLESDNLQAFRSSAIIKGLVKNYAREVGANTDTALAVLRRQLGEEKIELNKIDVPIKSNFVQITPLHIFLAVFGVLIVVLIGYLIKSYVSTLKYPSLIIETPKEKTITTDKPQITIVGVVEKDSILTINDQNIQADKDGKFEYTLDLNEGENIVQLVAVRKYDPDKKTIKKILVIYNKNNKEEQKKDESSNTTNDKKNEQTALKLNVQVKGGQSWIQVVSDNKQVAVGIKDDGYNKTFTIKKSGYIITGRPAITFVYANKTLIPWEKDGNTIKITCSMENNVWICNNKNVK